MRPGVETATVLDARPGEALTLYDADDNELITLIADDLGQAHFSYVGNEPLTIDTREGFTIPVQDGRVVDPGEYVIYSDEGDPTRWSGWFDVLAIDDVPDASLYQRQRLTGIHHSPLSGDDGDPQAAFQYIEVRDGTLLSAKVRFPDPLIYGDGPYPTVIEYSGYSPSRPDKLGTGQQIPNALGYAVVGVNMRGSGCSGGVFDVFNRAQHADGYDIVEVVARQDWVLHNQVGMVGVSYPGISQLFVASTNPPSLAAAVPLSVIADPWEMQWPGGIYNSGFTEQWLGRRNDEAEAGGSSWVSAQIEQGDTQCADNLQLSSQNIEFASFLHGLDRRPVDADDRDLNQLVRQIEAPMFVGGAWQDEQTGALFGGMLDRFDSSPHTRFLLFNGRHPDGFAPNNVFDWHEFLEFYVAERVPELPAILRTSLGAETFASEFGYTEFSFPEDRFTGMDYADVLAAYQTEPAVTVAFESGAGHPDAGTPMARWFETYDTWPPSEAVERQWFAAPGGQLTPSAPASAGHDRWTFDPEAGTDTFFGPSGYRLLAPIWDIDWKPFAEGDVASYLTEPLSEDTVLAGPAIATLWVNSPEPEVQAQVTLTEVRPDGVEVLVQSGWLALGHRAGTELEGLRIERRYDAASHQPVPTGEWVEAAVAIPSFAHAFRAGSQLKMSVSSPGRNHGTWEFEAPAYSGTPSFELGRGGGRATSLRLAELPGVQIQGELPPCPSLRGQPCRSHMDTPNDEVQ